MDVRKQFRETGQPGRLEDHRRVLVRASLYIYIYVHTTFFSTHTKKLYLRENFQANFLIITMLAYIYEIYQRPSGQDAYKMVLICEV